MSKSENRLKLNEQMPELAGEVSSFFEDLEQTKTVDETIFVMVPSYRDKDLNNTLIDLYSKAKDPHLLSVCVFDQSEKDVLVDFDKTNMHYIHTNYRNAKGIGHARNMIQNFYNNETYFLSIDSHMRFTTEWDVKCKQIYKTLKGYYRNPLVTNYCNELVYDYEIDLYPDDVKEQFTKIDNYYIKKDELSYIDVKKYTDYDGKRARKTPEEPVGEFRMSSWVSLHFTFTEGLFFRKMGFDSDHFFSGEEYNITLRSFTNGYDLISPYEPIMYHHYRTDSYRNEPQNYIVDNKKWADLDSKGILKNKLLTSGEICTWGLGDERDIESFFKYMRDKSGKKLSVDLD
tara:strand:- start:27252 stop:28283 length:1032 start_codon:yes stop_codon:yes gene_type:complete